MFKPQLETPKEDFTFNGFYRGIVMDVDDPKMSGRIKVKIYPMFKDIETINLPWAIYASGMGGYANVGNIDVPPVGSHVFCFFENGDHRFPVYFAGAPSIENDVPDVPTVSRESEATVTAINAARETSIATSTGGAYGSWSEPASAHAASYPKNRVYRSESGILIEIDDTTDNVRLHVYHPAGTRTEIDDSGNEVHHVAATHYEVVVGDQNVYIKGAQNVTIDGECNIKSTGGVHINSGTIDLGGGATEKLVLGNTFMTLFNSFVSTFNGHTHPDPQGGNTSAPNSSASSMSATHLSQQNNTTK